MPGEGDAPASISAADSQGLQIGKGNTQNNFYGVKPEIDVTFLNSLDAHLDALAKRAGSASPLADYSFAKSRYGTTGITQYFSEPSGREILVCSFEKPKGNRLTYRVTSRTLVHYYALGGVESWLGFPISDSRRVYQKVWLKRFEGGSIFNRDRHAPVAVPEPTLSMIEEPDGGTKLGWPVSDEEPIGTGVARIQFFEKGAVTLWGGRRRILLYVPTGPDSAQRG